MALSPNSAALAYLASQAGMPRLQLPDGRTLDRPHPEWLLHQLRWRWLLDSWEGGEAYRMAVYGFDIHGMPVRNLIRHKREYPSSFDANYAAQTGRPAGHRPGQPGDRRRLTSCGGPARRCPPSWPRRSRPTWRGSTAARSTARAPSGSRPGGGTWTAGARRSTSGCPARSPRCLLVLGQLDIIIDHPPVPEGEEIRSRADEVRLGLDTLRRLVHPARRTWSGGRSTGWAAIASAWSARSRTTARSCGGTGTRGRGRSSTRRASSLGGPVAHRFGRVPIVRLFDRTPAPVPEHRPAAVRGHRRAPARVLQPRQRADPLGHHPGASPAPGPRGLRPGRRDRADRPELAAAQEEELHRRRHHVRGLRRRAVPQGRGRLDPPEQGRPARRRRPCGAAAQARRRGGAHGDDRGPERHLQAAGPGGRQRPAEQDRRHAGPGREADRRAGPAGARTTAQPAADSAADQGSTTPPSSTSSPPRSWPGPSPSSRPSWPRRAMRRKPRASSCGSWSG